MNFVINADTSIANAIRRIIIGRIPSISIDTVCIQENDSCLCDEMIVHRLGLIPIRTTGTLQNFQISLEATGPTRVYSRDIMFEDKNANAVSPDIIILNLNKNERIKLTGNLEEGIGADHSKWSISCGTSYKKMDETTHHFVIETNGSFTPKEALLKSIQILKDDLIKYKKLLN